MAVKIQEDTYQKFLRIQAEKLNKGNPIIHTEEEPRHRADSFFEKLLKNTPESKLYEVHNGRIQ